MVRFVGGGAGFLGGGVGISIAVGFLGGGVGFLGGGMVLGVCSGCFAGSWLGGVVFAWDAGGFLLIVGAVGVCEPDVDRLPEFVLTLANDNFYALHPPILPNPSGNGIQLYRKSKDCMASGERDDDLTNTEGKADAKRATTSGGGAPRGCTARITMPRMWVRTNIYGLGGKRGGLL